MAKVVRMRTSGSGMMLVSLLFSAAFLPVIMLGMLDPNGFRLISKADEVKELRVWIEPAAVLVKPGTEFDINVMGGFDDEVSLIPEFRGRLNFDKEISVFPEEIVYKEPFRGTVKLGTVRVKFQQEGKYELIVDPESVFVSLPDISVVSAKSVFISER